METAWECVENKEAILVSREGISRGWPSAARKQEFEMSPVTVILGYLSLSTWMSCHC